MAFLIDEIRHNKILEAEVEVDKFIRENNISTDMMIFELAFDKSVFKEEVEAKDWLQSHCYFSGATVDNGNQFVFTTTNKNQLDLDTEITVLLRRGVTAKAAELIPIIIIDERIVSFNLSLKPDDLLNLSSSSPHIIEICKVIKGFHPRYGEIDITENHLESFVKNFKDRVVGIDLAINKDHEKVEALAWFKDVFLSFDKQTLFGHVMWNADGSDAVASKRFRYFSPELDFNFVHPLTQIEYGPTLKGGALTNYPFLEMDAITELNKKNLNKVGIKVNTIELSIHNEQMLELNTKLQGAQGDLVKTKADLESEKSKTTELSTKVKSLEDKIEESTKHATYDKLFSTEKINAAQLAALKEGKGLVEVMALNSKMNNKPKGEGTTFKEGDVIELSSDEKTVCKAMDLTPEEFMGINKQK